MAVSTILNFGQCSTFVLDIEGRVIPLYKGFPGWGVHLWSNILDTGLNLVNLNFKPSQGQIRGQRSNLT